MSRVGTQICGVCQCQFGDGDCIHFTGQGTVDDPYVPEIVIDPDTDNMVECGPGGLAVFLDPLYLNPPACNVYGTFDQPMPFDTAQVLVFNEERYDTDSMHSTEDPADSAHIVFNTPGLYLITLDVRWKKTNDSSATGDMAIFIRKNGSDYLGFDSFPVPGGDSFAKQSLTVKAPFEAGDYVDALAKHDVELDDEGMNLTITSERYSPVFSAVFLRPIQSMNILGVPESNPSEGGGGVGTETLLSGTQWWETPDHASLDITGDIDIRVAVAMTDWTPAGTQTLLGKWGSPNNTYAFSTKATTFGEFKISLDGTTNGTVDSTSTWTASDGQLIATRMTSDITGTNYTVAFYQKPTTAEDALTDCQSDSGWTLVSTVGPFALGGSAMFSGAASLTVGAQSGSSQFVIGSVYAAVIKDGINGTTVANPNFYANNSPFTDSSGRTWTKNG